VHALPASKGPPGEGPGASRRPAFGQPPDSSTRLRPRVLLVDDDESTRELYAWSLRAAGWIVECVASGEDALLAAPLFEPDVIVMDLRLPVVDGLEATRRLKASDLTRDIPVVAFSGFDVEQSDSLARQAGCDTFVAKPCPPDDLRAELERLVMRPTG
jgi:two-component system cell cycle response regulator DivK